MRRRKGYKFIGELPRGEWELMLLKVRGSRDIVVVADRTGQNAPRAIIDGKLVKVAP